MARTPRLLTLPLRAAWEGLRGFLRSDDLTHASSIAYFALLSLFPLLLLGLGLLGAAAASDADRTAVMALVARHIPHQFEFIATQVEALHQARWSLGLVGTVLVAWASLGVFDAITAAVNHAWGVAQPRGFLHHKLVSLAMLAAAGLMLLGVLVLVSVDGVLRSGWFGTLLGTDPALLARYPLLAAAAGGVTAWAATALFVVMVALLLRFLPNTTVRMRDVWPGAVLTGLLWHGALALFARFLGDLGRFSVHGSIAAVVAFLLWVYVQAALLLYGVEFTAAWARLRRAADGPPPEPSPAP